MNQARDRVLSRIRSSLVGAPAVELPRPRIVVPNVPAQEREAKFFAALEKLNAKAFSAASPDAACRYVREVIAGSNGSASAVASNAQLLAECGITRLAGVRTGFASVDELRAACASTAWGITAATYALADTGTLVMLSSQEEARMISLVPPAHIAIVPRANLLTGLDELFTILPRPAEQSSSMVFITGPSRTADIEQILVRGVHGPGEVHVVLL